jgi:hypothetical protein
MKRDESVGAVRCVNCSRHYLLLDSEDYWFDVIQHGYPRPTRCSCKSESFRLSIDYGFRDDGDVNYIQVSSTCSACGRTRRQLGFEIDYGPTGHLVERPLVPVGNPKILYDLKQLTLFVTWPDIARVIDYLGEAKCSFLSVVSSGGEWVSRVEDSAGVNATIQTARYRVIYAMPAKMEIAEHQITTTKKEEAFWKRSEVIRIGSKMHICKHGPQNGPVPSISYGGPPANPDDEIGLYFDIWFSNEFVVDESIHSKSESFRAVTAGLMAMLRKDFVSWRAPDCFDNPVVNVGALGDRFQKKAAAKKRA